MARQETVTITYHKFNELSETAKEKAREWYRGVNDFDFEAECVLDDAKEVAKYLGIKIDKIYYSGFSSQGDGACFTGTFNYDSKKLLEARNVLSDDLQDIIALLLLTEGVRAEIKHRGHYYHSGCMDIQTYATGDSESCLKEAEILVDALKAFADWIYSSLEKAYNFTQSNEYVDEAIEANDYEFNENGKRI